MKAGKYAAIPLMLRLKRAEPRDSHCDNHAPDEASVASNRG